MRGGERGRYNEGRRGVGIMTGRREGWVMRGGERGSTRGMKICRGDGMVNEGRGRGCQGKECFHGRTEYAMDESEGEGR